MATQVQCTKESPYDKDSDLEKGGGIFWLHVDAREVGEQEDGWPGGDIVTYECPHCMHRWKVELAQ